MLVITRSIIDLMEVVNMKRKTYNNVVKLAKQITKKGYNWDESSKISIDCFDKAEGSLFSAEHFADMILSKEEWIKETELYYSQKHIL